MAAALTACLAVFLACASVYAGTMWCVRLFLYQSWVGLTPDNVGVHFTGPVKAATRFFTILFPIATVSGVAVLALSWWSWASLAIAVSLAWLYITLGVFRRYLVPVNTRIEESRDPHELTTELGKWMHWNNVRWMTTTAVWVAAVWCVLAAGDVGRVTR
ncbi:MAG: hypothetical protein QOJ03_859 [Frankiaceae bacterium]|jgi:hypothetical protein|nr:hypothetical protein [Frankiaceae bacterium]